MPESVDSADESVGQNGREQLGNPTGFGLRGPPEFETDEIVDWRCPLCHEDGFHKAHLRPSFVCCTNIDCAVQYFTCFRGEPDEQ